MLFTTFGFSAIAQATTTIHCIVLDVEGQPLEGAKASIWYGEEFLARLSMDHEGRFQIEVEANTVYTIYVYSDDGSTPGVDYLPSRIEARPWEGNTYVINLLPAASVVFEGDVQFVESDEVAFSTVYTVLDYITGNPVEGGGFPFVWGAPTENPWVFLDLRPGHIVVPAGVPFKIGVESNLVVDSKIVARYFEVDDPSRFTLGKGEKVVLDIRENSVPFNHDAVRSKIESVELRLDEMEALGFYLVAERKAITSAKKWLSEASYLLDEERLIESFDAAKKGYIEVWQTQNKLDGLFSDASFSVFLIIVFLAFTSTTISFLLSNGDAWKVTGSVLIYAVKLAVLYFTYPGSVMVPIRSFLGTAVLSLAVLLTIAMLIPRLMKARGRGGHVPVRNIIVPIASLAKRSIQRRRLRFVLTLTSITVLVMSFVSLTSFSEGYGLIVTRVPGSAGPLDGVLIRAKGYSEMDPIFLSQKDVFSGWLGRQRESVTVSPKAENLPFSLSVVSLNGRPLMGVLGFDPLLESSIIGIEDALTAGQLPSENGIAISEDLRDMLGVKLGDELTLDSVLVELEGVLDDDSLRDLRDLEGSSYLPGKLVNTNPEGDTASFVVEPCDPSEVVFVHLQRALSLPLVGISRVDIVVDEGIDVRSFAERLALERGYWTWSVSEGAINFIRVSSYLQGKGASLVVPWGIVVLNVMVAMLNSMYERRKEIHILSSVGLNPAQISAVFFTEASIVGLTGGGLGYLAGLSLYKGMAFFGLALAVQQKISAFWSLAAIGISMTAVLMGAFAALKSSVVITPSLRRRWRIEGDYHDVQQPWIISIPIKLPPEEVKGFIEYAIRYLRKLENHLVLSTSSIKVYDHVDGTPMRVDFVYKSSTSMDSFHTKNTLILKREDEGEAVVVKLVSRGEQRSAHTTGSLIRLMMMRWNTSKRT